MMIDEGLYQEFRRRYGTVAANLVIFYTLCRTHGDRYLRMHYDERTYYRYRHTLVRDGYLSVDEFLSKGGGPAYVP